MYGVSHVLVTPEPAGGTRTPTHKPVTTIRFADYGVHVINSGIIASKETIEKHPDLVKRFMRASTKAFEDAVKSPDDAVDALLKAQPKAGHRRTGPCAWHAPAGAVRAGCGVTLRHRRIP